MAGVSTPLLAAEVSQAGAIGSIGLGSSTPDVARTMIQEVRERTDRAFNVNFFVHEPARHNQDQEAKWIERLSPAFAQFGVIAPRELREIYKSFNEDAAMLAMLLESPPPLVSFHFGAPKPQIVQALHERGVLLLATATNLDEARDLERAGIDILVAQGIEAGGHRGIFNTAADDPGLGTLALTRLLVRETNLPVVAAGAIMDGAGIAAASALGAIAGQMGTAFISCPESAADEAYRSALFGEGNKQTHFTSAISGRPARSLPGGFSEAPFHTEDYADIPDYPIAYDAAKALHSAAKQHGEHKYGAFWAGQGAPLCRAMPARRLIQKLAIEFDEACTIAAQ